MKRFLMAAIAMVALGVTVPKQEINAQVYGEFQPVVLELGQDKNGVPYEELSGNSVVVIPRDEFGMPPTFATDYDDGYKLVPLGFEFEFNGEIYDHVYICVNGFVTFSRKVKQPNGTITLVDPPFVQAVDPEGLFKDSPSFPVNVLAPFWGDHYYRNDDDVKNGFMGSTISYLQSSEALTIEWKNLNINKKNDEYLPSSIANFQVKIYKSTDRYSKQGDIEFCYGGIGGNPNTPNTDVVYTGSSIGIKGETHDFMNGLKYIKENDASAPTPDDQTKMTDKTFQWQPSDKRSDARIKFIALATHKIEEWWGDGDVDFTKAEGKIHEGMKQNRFVTINDARVIMRAVVNQKPLDALRRRQAYHADVNHNGRYFINDKDEKILIQRRDYDYSENLPEEVSSVKQILFEANEHDASWILRYMAAKIPSLPWIHDITVDKKQSMDNEVVADNFKLGQVSKIQDGIYSVPVFVNKDHNGAVSFKFNTNVAVKSVTTTNSDVLAENGKNIVVVAANGDFKANEAICVIRFESNDDVINLTDVRFNDVNKSDMTANTSSVNSSDSDEIKVGPNPVKTEFNVITGNADVTKVEIFNTQGDLVRTLTSDNNFIWDVKDNNNNVVNNGVYFVKITGNDVNVTKKVVVSK